MITPKKQLGFSIIEIILVIAVTGAIVLVLANLPASINLIGKSGHESIAQQIAQQTVENLRGTGYANLGKGTVQIVDNRLSKLPGGAASRIIEDCPAAICQPDEKTYKVTITVSWSEKTEPRSVILTTMISEGGLQ